MPKGMDRVEAARASRHLYESRGTWEVYLKQAPAPARVKGYREIPFGENWEGEIFDQGNGRWRCRKHERCGCLGGNVHWPLCDECMGCGDCVVLRKMWRDSFTV